MLSHMAKKILILGGTRYVGKRLIALLLAQGHEVTIATRGQTENPFGDNVRHIIVDRIDEVAMAEALGQEGWDIVYDQICYSSADAAEACEIFKGNVGRYILNSSFAVYQTEGLHISEEAFDPLAYCVPLVAHRTAFDYAEGKRLVEAVFAHRAGFPVTAVRFPLILGLDDPDKRLQNPIQAIQQNKLIKICNKHAFFSLISSEQAADFLCWLADNPIEGAVNACAIGMTSAGQIVEDIERIARKTAIVASQACEKSFPLFAKKNSLVGNVQKAKEAGYHFSVLGSWLPHLIQAVV